MFHYAICWDLAMDIWEEETRLARTLGALAVADVVAGSLVLATAGRRSPVAKGIGRQAVGWGLVNGAIAGVAEFRRRKEYEEHPSPQAAYCVGPRAARLRRMMTFNCGLDVVYVGVGKVMAWRAPAGSVRRGDGVGIVLQGLMLGALDGSSLKRLTPEERIDRRLTG